MKNKLLEKLHEFAYFIWLILLIFITVLVTYFYDSNKKNQFYYLKKSFDNVYLKKSINSLTSKLEPRYVTIDYKIQKGDTYESILDSINIPNKEKKIILNEIKTVKEIKSLKINQNILFKIDRKDNIKIIEFKVEIDKKKMQFLLEIQTLPTLILKLLKTN